MQMIATAKRACLMQLLLTPTGVEKASIGEHGKIEPVCGRQGIGNPMSENKDCDFKELDSLKKAVVNSVTDESPIKEPANKAAKNKRDYPVKHGLYLDFRKVQVDRRTRLGKWIKQLRKDLVEDLGGKLTAMEEVLLDRIVSKVVQAHLYETGILSGEDFGSRDFYLAVCNSLRRDLAVIGLKKKTEKLLDLGEHLKQKGTKEL
jgi:hypothetical protein